MTSNLLSLYSAKTEFLLIGLKQQLSKIHNLSTSRDTTQSTRYLCTTVFRNTIIVSNTSRMLFLVLLYCRLKNSNTSITPRTLFTLRHSDQTIIIAQSLIAPSNMLLHLIFGPASYITQNSSSKLFTPSQRPSNVNIIVVSCVTELRCYLS